MPEHSLTEREFGNITPLRELFAEIDEWEKREAALKNPERVAVLQVVCAKLSVAITRATEPVLEMFIEEYARLERITPWAAYKRYNAGKIPGAHKNLKGRIVIPTAHAEERLSA